MGYSGRTELLAPAGNAEGFYGAVHAGADAVYLGGTRFGARAYAENFTEADLIKCIQYGHFLGRKIYLAVNTLLKQREMEELYTYLLPFYKEGLDAVIVQDLGVLRFVRENFPDLKIHASTQMTLCSSRGVSLLKEMGAERVVPARELTLREVGLLKSSPGLADMEIECFVHGAMCYCYSGQCLFSSILGGRSGNRGRCAQPCRLPYSVKTQGGKLENCHPISLKDMCTIEHIPQMIEAGIDSFKIEGRMKKPEYTAGVTEIYRRYIDRYYELREEKGAQEAARIFRVEKRDWKVLKSLYIRSGVQDGYYFRRGGADMVTLDSPAYGGSDDGLLAEIRRKHIDLPLKLPVAVSAAFRAGEPAEVAMVCMGEGESGISCTVRGETVGKAEKQPITEPDVASRLGRLGDSVFYAQEIQVSVGKESFYPMGQINELRRRAAEGLEQQILSARGYGAARTVWGSPEVQDSGQSGEEPPVETAYGCIVSVRTLHQLEEAADWICRNRQNSIQRIYIDSDLFVWEWEKTSALCAIIVGRCCGVYAALPYILRSSDDRYLETVYVRAKESGMVEGFLVRSLDGMGFVREKERAAEKSGGGKRMLCRGDAGVYVWNRAAAREMRMFLDGFCLPYELNAKEQKELLQTKDSWEKIVYGRIPMMITANCLRRTAGKCTGGGSLYGTVLRDRYHKVFPVEVDCRRCMNIIYNGVPLSLHKELSRWRNRAGLRMDFVLESREEMRSVMDSFMTGAPCLLQEYTAGHEKRGVE